MQQIERKAKILVVDDNAENRALAQAALEDEGYSVVLAPSGEDGVRAFQEEDPDCVLLDVRMPGTDGFSVCTRIRALPGGAHAPIVFLTALRDVDTFDRALRAGGDDFLTKPVRPAELVVRVQAALKLRRMSSELREYYEIVRRQRDELMRLQLQKERLTAFVVHDLKNPLSAIDLHAQFLMRDAGVSLRSRTSAQGIRDGVRSLLSLILNLLDISKSEEGQLVPRYGDVDLQKLVAELVDAHELQAKGAGLTFERDLRVESVRADADLLRRVIENLIDNAVRHAPAGTRVCISTTSLVDTIEIRVADAGPGIPLEMRERIFDRFAQLDSGERVVSRTGHGLGLTFCKLAVESHGGNIWVEDGKPGAVFCMSLPYVH